MICLGVGFHSKSPALREDILIAEEEGKELTREMVEAAYDAAGTNCLLTALLYVLTLAFSIWQVYENNKNTPYLVN